LRAEGDEALSESFGQFKECCLFAFTERKYSITVFPQKCFDFVVAAISYLEMDDFGRRAVFEREFAEVIIL